MSPLSRAALLCAASTAAVLCASAAFAQDEATDVERLIITAQSLEQTLPLELSRYGNDIEIVDSGTIDDRTYLDTAEVLRMVIPGLSLIPYNGPFSYHDLSLQGSRQVDVLWLVDGIRVNNRLYSTTAPADTLPSSMIERVEVLKGGQSLFYGTNAAAGVINVVTRGFSDEFDGEISLGGHTNDGFHVDGMARGSVGGHKYVVYGSIDQAEGYPAFHRYEASALDQDRGYDVRTGGVKYGYDFTEDLSFSIRYQHTDAVIDDARPSRIAQRFNERSEDIVSANLDFTPSEAFQMFVKAYYHRWNSFFALSSNPPGGPPGPLFKDRWWFNDQGVNILARFSPDGSPFEYLVGYDHQAYEGADAVLLIAQTAETVNAGVLQIRTTDNLSENGRFALGARYTETGGSSATVWNASGRWDFSPSFYVEGTVGTAFVLPDIYQLFAIDPFDTFGNPDLEPEESRNINLSVGGATMDSRFEWQATWFDRKIDNLISDVAGTFQNTPGEVKVDGFELAGAFALNDDWTISGSYVNTDARDAGASVQRQRIPESFAKAQLAYDPAVGRFGGSVQAIWQGNVYNNQSPARINYGDYYVVDLAAHMFIDPETRLNKLTLRIENLFDEEYTTFVRNGSLDAGGTAPFFHRGVPQTFHLTYTRRFRE